MAAFTGKIPAPTPEPAISATAITPSDGTPLSVATRALYIGVTGDVTVDMLDSSGPVATWQNILFKAMPVGLYPLRVTRVYATGTTATNIVGVW